MALQTRLIPQSYCDECGARLEGRVLVEIRLELDPHGVILSSENANDEDEIRPFDPALGQRRMDLICPKCDEWVGVLELVDY